MHRALYIIQKGFCYNLGENMICIYRIRMICNELTMYRINLQDITPVTIILSMDSKKISLVFLWRLHCITIVPEII